jgi:hypothetical protein
MNPLRIIMPDSLAAAVQAASSHRSRRALSILVLAVPTHAESPVKVLEEFGLYGTWADDCNAKPTPTNPYTVFQLTSRGNVELRHDFGPDYDEMVYRIVEAQRISYYRLGLRQLLTSDDQIALSVVMMKSNDRFVCGRRAAPMGAHLWKTERFHRRKTRKPAG